MAHLRHDGHVDPLVHVGILGERLHVSDAAVGEQPGDPAERGTRILHLVERAAHPDFIGPAGLSRERREDVGDVEFRPGPEPFDGGGVHRFTRIAAEEPRLDLVLVGREESAVVLDDLGNRLHLVLSPGCVGRVHAAVSG